jgi:hypothetical protein
VCVCVCVCSSSRSCKQYEHSAACAFAPCWGTAAAKQLPARDEQNLNLDQRELQQRCKHALQRKTGCTLTWGLDACCSEYASAAAAAAAGEAAKGPGTDEQGIFLDEEVRARHMHACRLSWQHAMMSG